MKKNLLFISMCLLSSILYAKNIKLDSLQVAISKLPNDSNKVKKIVEYIFSNGSRNETNPVYWANESFSICKKINWPIGIAITNEKLGRYYWNTGKYTMALAFHFKALHQFKNLNKIKDYWDIVVMIGQDFANASQYDNALVFLKAALNAYKASQNIGGISYTLGILAWVYSSKGDYVVESQILFEKIKLEEQNKDSMNLMITYFDLTSNYLHLQKNTAAEQILNNWYPYLKRNKVSYQLLDYHINMAFLAAFKNKLDSAFYHYEQEKQIGIELKNGYWIANAYANMANLQIVKKDFSAAIKNLDSAYKYYNQYHQFKELVAINCKKTISYLQLKKIQEAKKSTEEAGILIKKFDSKVSNLAYFEAKYLFDSASNNWQSAFYYLNLYRNLCNEIYNKENTQQLLEMQIRYEADKREEILKQENRTVFWSLIILAVLTIILALFFIQLYFKNKKINKLNAIQLTMLHEIHHRVKNNLQLISGFMQLQLHKTTDLPGRSALEESINNIQVVALVHENLYNQSADLVKLQTYVPRLCAGINSFTNSLVQPEIKIHCDDMMLTIDQTIPIGLILNELITNSIKYAFPEPTILEPKINIHISRKEKQVMVYYADNGIGIKDTGKKGNSIGLKLIKMLVQELKGNYSIDGKKGFIFDLKFNMLK